ncbi:MAG: FliO/MopB family protein [Spirochaetota bacterium]
MRKVYSIIIIILFCGAFALCPIKTCDQFHPVSGAAYAADETGKPEAGKKKEKKTSDETDITGKKKAGETGEKGLYDYEEPSTEEQSYGWLIFKTILILGTLVAGFYFFFQYVTKKAGIQTVGQNVVQVLSIVPVGQNKFLQVVDMAGKILVLGVSDNNINLITEIHEKDEIDRIRLLSSRSAPPAAGGFQEFVTNQVGRVFDRVRGTGKDAQSQYGRDHDFEKDSMQYLNSHRSRLRKLNGDETDN